MPIRKLLIAAVVALVCLGLYEGFVRLSRVQPRGASLGFENQIRLEDYAQAKDVQDSIVLIGSSVTQNLTTVGHVPGIWNLGISGGSALTGAVAVLSKGVNPKAVLIEEDVTLTFPADSRLAVSSLKLRSMTKSGSPMSLILGKFFSNAGYVPADDQGITELRDKHLAEFKLDPRYNATPDQLIKSSDYQKSVQELATFVEAMHAKNVPVYFFEVPPYGSLSNRPGYPLVKQRVDAFCAQGLATRLPSLPTTQTRTVDGIHLVRPDAGTAFDRLMQEFKSR